MSLLQTDSANGEAVNIGSTDTIEIQELADVVVQPTNADVEIEYAPRHGADAEHTHGAVDKARRLLGYDPVCSIPEGIQSFINWYQHNRDWYETLVLSS
jgi:UDP-glucose 4-epimerase